MLEESTLVIGPSWVGDMVMAQSLLKAIKEEKPNTQIDVLAPEWSHSLTERMPEVRRGLSMPVGHGQLGLKKRYEIAKTLRNCYQSSYILPNSFKSALIPYWAKIPKRIGWRGEWRYNLLNDIRVLDKKRFPLMVQRYAALAYPEGSGLKKSYYKPKLSVSELSVKQALQEHNLSLENGLVLSICPGAEFGPSKRWPDSYYAQLARYYKQKGYQIWIFGSNKDSSVASLINQQSQKACIDLCGKTSLAEAIDLLSVSSLVVSNDSGLMHIAASLDKPLIAVYGSTDPTFTPPLNERVKIIRQSLECSPCFKRECPLQHHNCMKRLHPNRVIEAAEELIQQ